MLMSLLLGCGELVKRDSEVVDGTAADTQADSDPADSGSDTGGPRSGLVWFVGGAVVEEGKFQSGYCGMEVTAYEDFDVVYCRAVGPWSVTGEAPSGCPQCDWSFQLVVGDPVEDPPGCGTGLVDRLDGSDGAWGFADDYEVTYGGSTYHLDNVVFYYFVNYGAWYYLSYNYAGYGYNTGDASDMSFRASTGYAYYYSP